MRIFSKTLLIVLIGSAVLFGGIFGFKAFVNQMVTEIFDNMEPEPATISTSIARESQWTPIREAVGTFRTVQGADLAVQMDGIVEEIGFENGVQVEKGQNLVTLDAETDRAELDRLQADLRLAKLELERQSRLYDQDSVAEAALDRAESEADQARAAVAAQEARLRLKTLRAPFSGTVGIRRVNTGQFVRAGTHVVTLQSLDPIFLDFNVPQRFLPHLRTGASVTVRIDAWPGETFTGAVTAIEPRLQESSRTIPVQATLENPDHRLRPGMFGRVILAIGDAETVLLIPQTAVRFSTYGNSVFVVVAVEGETNNTGDPPLKVVQRFIQTGDRRGDLIVVTEGLEAGDEIASSGLLKLRNNARIQINNDEETRPTEDLEPSPRNG